MAYTSEHMLLQWGGSFRGGTATAPIQEIFSGSLRFQGPGIAQADDDQTCGALALALQRFWVAPGSQIPSTAYLESVKWNRIGVDGKYVSDRTRGVTPSDVHGQGSAQYPHQVAWVTTWQTDVVRGKASTGRTFWPTGVVLDSSTGHVAQTLTKNFATFCATLIKNLNFAARTGNVPAPPSPPPTWLELLGYQPSPGTRPEAGLSAVVMSKIGSGTTRVITAAGVGDRLDIQRRRGNQMGDRRQVTELASVAD